MHVYTYMATKTISITREAYDRLRARKGRDESFTDVILRLTERRPLADYAGMLSKSSVRAIRAAIDEARRAPRDPSSSRSGMRMPARPASCPVGSPDPGA